MRLHVTREPILETYTKNWKKVITEPQDRGEKLRKEDLLELANWAIEHGILEDAAKTERAPKIDGIPSLMKELAHADVNDRAVQAFQQIEKEMAGIGVGQDGAAGDDHLTVDAPDARGPSGAHEHARRFPVAAHGAALGVQDVEGQPVQHDGFAALGG